MFSFSSSFGHRRFTQVNHQSRSRRAAIRLLAEQLEERLVLTSSLDAQGVLHVTGTTAADTIAISLNSATQKLDVSENGSISGSYTVTNVLSMDIKSDAGNDTVTIGTGFVINTTTDLGPGLDKFTGGQGDDYIRAQDGASDTIDGGLGQDGVWSDSPDFVSNVEFLNPIATSTDNARQTVRVMVINFDPLVPGEGNKLMHGVFNWMSPQDLSVRYQQSMEKSSGGAVKFDIVKWNNLNEIPVFEDGFQYTPDQYVANRRANTNWHTTSTADFRKIVNDNGVVDLINSGEVDEVWCIGDHFYSLPGESWMAGPNAFWINGPVFSDIPTVRPFACMGFSYERPDTLTHNMGHRTESTMNQFYGGWNLASPQTNWDKFSGNAFQSNGYSGVGTCHYPANGTSDYDYANTRTVTSTADDFLNYPNLSGSTIPVNNTSWSKFGTEPQWEYLEWYYARLPRAQGTNADGRQNNWWKYLYNFDNYNTDGSPKPIHATAITGDVISGGRPTQTVQVAYAGATFINRATLDDNDIDVLAPNGTRLGAHLVRVNSSENSPYLVATYEITAPTADWSTAPAGTYTVNIKAGQVADVKGASLPGSVLGAFAVRASAANGLTAANDTSLLLPLNGSTTGSAGETPTTSQNITYQAGKVGQAAYLNNSLLKYPVNNNIATTAGTIEFFLKPDWAANTITPSAFFQVGNSFNNGLYLQIDGANNVRLIEWGDDPATSQVETSVERGVGVSGSAWRGGNWYHVAATWDEAAGQIALYVNGQLAQKSAQTVKIPAFATSDFTIGSAIDGSSKFKGNVDDFRISTRALSPSEILTDYRNAFGMSSFAIQTSQTTFKTGDYFTPGLIATLDDNSTRDLTTATVWTTSDPALASVDSKNQVRLLKPGQVKLQARIGTAIVEKLITIADGGRPSATLSGSSLPIQTGTGAFQFQVTYADPDKVLQRLLGSGDVYVSGPAGFHQHPRLVGTTPAGDSASITATYEVAPPDGVWTPAFNGPYQIQLKDWQVADPGLNFARELDLGTLSLNVSPRTDLELTASPPPWAGKGANFSTTWHVANKGPNIAQNISVSVTLPAGLGFVSSSVPAIVAGNLVTVNLGNVAAGAMADVTLTLLPTAFGQVVIPAQVSSVNIETNPANNACSTSVTVYDSAGAFRFDSSTLTTGEKGGPLSVQVNRIGGSGGAAFVSYSIVPGTATAGADYNAPASGTLNFADGQTSATFTINILDDSLYEGTETLNLSLNSPSSGSAIATPAACLVKITDDEPVPGLSIADASAPEGNGPGSVISFTVSLSAPSGLPTTVNYHTAPGLALAGADYVAKSGTLTFAPGELTKTITIDLVGDTQAEYDEQFAVDLDTAVGALISQGHATGTIVNDDPLPSLSVADATITELTGVNAQMMIIVTLSAPSNLPVTVQYATAPGSATAPDDFTAQAGQLTFLAGETNKTVKALITGDSLNEDDEWFSFTLDKPKGATIDRATARCTIKDNDPAPTLSIDNLSVTEPDTGSTATATFTVKLSAPSGRPVQVHVETADATALAGKDYTATAADLVIPAGVLTQTFPVTILGDRVHEPTESFTVKLSAPVGATLGTASGTGTILDNDPQIYARIGDATLVEGDSGTTVMIFAVTLTSTSEVDFAVDYHTLDGTATAGPDYVQSTGRLTIPAGQTSGSIRVPVVGDLTVEQSSKTFNVVLTNPAGGEITTGAGTGTGTIRDNDSSGTISFESPTFSVNENDASGLLRLVVRRTFGDVGPIDIPYQLIEETARAGLDFTGTGGIVHFDDGQRQANIVIPIINDTLVESAETFAVKLGTPSSGGRLGTTPTARVTIVSDDIVPPGPRITAIKPVVSKGVMSSIVLTLSEDLDPATVKNLSAYTLAAAGKDKKFNTKDDVKYKITKAVYSPASHTLTISHTAIKLTADLQLTISGSGTTGLKSTTGRLLDGNRDGTPGGDGVIMINKTGQATY